MNGFYVNVRKNYGYMTNHSKSFTRLFGEVGLLTAVFVALTALASASTENSRPTGSSGVQAHRTVQRTVTTNILHASYFRVAAGVKSSLMLSNQGPQVIPITVTIFSETGVPVDLPPIALDGLTAKSFDLQSLLSTVEAPLSSGNLQVTYQGSLMEISGAVIISDQAKGLIFEEELTEPTVDFKSARLDGLWWVPSRDTTVNVSLANTTDRPVMTEVSITGETTRRMVLAPHSSHLLRVNHIERAEEDQSQSVGAMTIEHSGVPGAVIAHGFTSQPLTGYSNDVDFADPQTSHATQLDGAGLRVRDPQGNELLSIITLRNLAKQAAAVSGKIFYTGEDGTAGEMPLSTLTLASDDIRVLNLQDTMRNIETNGPISAAGIEINYSVGPGLLLASAMSMSRTGDEVFRVPLRDVTSQHSSTGHYPWSLSDGSNSVIYIKNATAESQQYYLHIQNEKGIYSLGITTLLAHQTVAFDIRKLQAARTPDVHGSVIPEGAEVGQVHWFAKSTSNNRPLLGRVEQTDVTNRLSNTSACGVCCPDSYDYSYNSPEYVTASHGDQNQQATAYVVYMSCYGQQEPAVPAYWATWSSSDSSIASVDPNGNISFVSAGDVSIDSAWTDGYYTQNTDDTTCSYNYIPAGASTFVSVVPTHVMVRSDNSGTSTCTPNCVGSVSRTIYWQAVYRDNTNVNKTIPIVETLSNISPNTCNTGEGTPGPCGNVPYGQFTDIFDTNYSSSISPIPHCGFTLDQTYEYCPASGSLTIAHLPGDGIYSDYITINGVTTPNAMPPGTMVY